MDRYMNRSRLFIGGCMMAETTKPMPERKDIPEEYTWKLEDIIEKDEMWEKEFTALTEDIPKITEYQGTLASSAEKIYEVFQLQDTFSERLSKLYTYARMRHDQDTANSKYQTMQGKDRKSTRLNSSHVSISYAVFCLKKKR